MRQFLWVLAFAAVLSTPGLAHAGPVAAAVATWVSTSLLFSGTISVAASTFVFYAVQAAIYVGSTLVLTKLTAPKLTGAGQERQANVTSLSLGETPAEVIYGEAATAGSLLDVFNHGGTYGTDWETIVVAVADHLCEGLVGYYVGETYYEFTGDGDQTGFGGQLKIWWHDGAWDQTADPWLTANGPDWASSDRVRGRAYVVAAYKADAPNATSPVWSTGRPSFLWRVKGRKVYDTRKDSTRGGSGAHRADTPSTWEWSDNAILCRYDYTRGVYAGDDLAAPSKLLIGRGLSLVEAPPERVVAFANVCDELVALKAGGTERRYRVNGVISAADSFGKVDEYFAAAMAGVIVQHEGGVEVEPGVSKSAVVTFTDLDLAVGYPRRVEHFAGENDRLNTVTPRYVEPSQLWRNTAAPVRRSLTDIADDGGQRVQSLTLDLVTSNTQAQRCGEIFRRLARRERRASITLPPRFCYLEEGDWVSWTSDRYFGGDTVTFRIEAQSQDQGLRSALVLREIAASCYAWTAASDEGTPGQAPVDEPGSLTALALSGVAITAFRLIGGDGTKTPAVRATWSAPVDPAIRAVRLELRLTGETEVTPTLQLDPNAGVLVTTDGVASQKAMQGRLVPLTYDGRLVTPSAWVDVTTSAFSYAQAVDLLALIPSKNLWRRADYVPEGGAALVKPLTLGASLWGFTFPGATLGAKVKVTPHTQGLGVPYSWSCKAKVDSGTAKIRCGWRDAGGGTISDLPDQIFNLTTTLQRFTWDAQVSADADFTSAIFQIFQDTGDIPSGRLVTVTDQMIIYGPESPSQWLPCLDDADLLEYAGYLGALDATRNAITVGASAPSSPANGDLWVDTSTTPYVLKTRVAGAWQVSAANGGAFGNNLYRTPGGSLATLSDFLTSLGVAAAIDGQSAWATYVAKNPTGALAYIGTDGRINAVDGFPSNAPSGRGMVMSSWPLSASDSSISVGAFTLSGVGFSRSFPSATISGLGGATPHNIFAANWLSGSPYYTAVLPEYSAAYFASDNWLFIGQQYTKSSGVYPAPYDPPAGSGYAGPIFEFTYTP